jgi:septal ring factor EnvC (AmiA/AmiB activator)
LNDRILEEDGGDEHEMKELIEAIQKMEKLILKTQPTSDTTTTADDLLDDDTSEREAVLTAMDIEARLSALTVNADPSSTPDRLTLQHAVNGSSNNRYHTPPKRSTHTTAFVSNEGDVLHHELARIQGLLGSVMKRRQRGIGASTGTSAATEEEVRNLRAALEQQEVATSLRQADSSFLQAQLEEKDNLLAEVSKLLESVEERQSALEAENAQLRSELAAINRLASVNNGSTQSG